MSVSAVVPYSSLGASIMSGPQLVSSAPSQLTFDRRQEAAGVTLVVRGEIDIASAPALEHALQDIERSSPPRIVLDLAALDFLDSTGIHLLIRAQERASAARHQLSLTHVPVHARRLFELTGISDQLDIE